MPIEDEQERVYGYKYNFRVRARAIRSGFSKVSGVSEEIEVVDKRDGVDPFQVRKIKGTQQGGTMLLERGVVQKKDTLFAWFKAVKDEDVPYWADVDVIVYSGKGIQNENHVATINAKRAWPNRYELGELDAKASDIEVEILSVVHEGIEWLNF
jgi:phage tail-like protein